jgi:hypothetical protein
MRKVSLRGCGRNIYLSKHRENFNCPPPPPQVLTFKKHCVCGEGLGRDFALGGWLGNCPFSTDLDNALFDATHRLLKAEWEKPKFEASTGKITNHFHPQ